MGSLKVDMDLLLKLRLVIGRYGEMDIAKWWNTKGQLGRLGAMAIRRGFPRTHYFAQARAVFAVAGHRCQEVFDPPNSVTLWRLPENIEEEFDTCWEHWLDRASEWKQFFLGIEAIQSTNLAEILRSLELVSDNDIKSVPKSRHAAERRAIELPGVFTGANNQIVQLAVGFTHGENGSLTVPYMRCS